MENLAAEEAGVRVEEEKKLYVFLSHYCGEPYVYSFYEVPIPSPGDLSSSTEVVEEVLIPRDLSGSRYVLGSTEVVEEVSTEVVEEEEFPILPRDSTEVVEEKRRLNPILCFNSEEHGIEMCCAQLDSKIYFIGGCTYSPDGTPLYQKTVCTLDTCSGMPQPNCNPYENTKKILKYGPRMNAPKLNPIAFGAQGKIFVLGDTVNLSGPLVEMNPFEMFTPPARGSSECGVWEILDRPPFLRPVGAHFVVNHKLFVCCRGSTEEVYIYDINSKSWVRTINAPLHFGLARGSGSLVVENNKLYSHCPYSLLQSTIDWASIDSSDNVPPCKWKKFNVVNTFSSPCPTSYLAGIGNRKFSFLQVGCSFNPHHKDDGDLLYNEDECLLDLVVFDSMTNKILGCGAFTVDPFGARASVVTAFALKQAIHSQEGHPADADTSSVIPTEASKVNKWASFRDMQQ